MPMLKLQALRLRVSSVVVKRLVFLVLAGMATAVAALWSACWFHAETECGSVLLAVVSGAGGGVAASVGPAWRPARTIDCIFRGICPALIVYYVVRGLLVQSATTPTSIRGCGMVALCLLVGLGRSPRRATPSMASRIARPAIVVALLILSVEGCIDLCGSA
jgi:hypothetical protein